MHTQLGSAAAILRRFGCGHRLCGVVQSTAAVDRERGDVSGTRIGCAHERYYYSYYYYY
jgi:hypothetical protein